MLFDPGIKIWDPVEHSGSATKLTQYDTDCGYSRPRRSTAKDGSLSDSERLFLCILSVHYPIALPF